MRCSPRRSGCGAGRVWSPGRLMLVTVLQYAEHLTDRQAAEAVRTRIDWKIGLGLDLADEWFDASILTDFRNRLVEHGMVEQALDVPAPDWLAATLDVADWTARYGIRIDTWRLPSSQSRRDALATAYGHDGFTLLRAVYAADAPHWLGQLPAVDTLRQVLLQHYVIVV